MSEQQVGKQLLLVYLIAASALTGIQAILPALPAIQAEFGLTHSKVALVTSAYLFPSVVLAIPFGMLADRFGRRVILSVSLGCFGTAGLAIAYSAGSYETLIAWRIAQGAAFAAILPLTITLIGDLRTGARQIAAQGHRSIAMFGAETIYPIIGAALVAFSWSAPFALQAITIPLGIVAWFAIPDVTRRSRPERSTESTRLTGLLRRRDVLALGGLTFARFFFKFGFLTYLPILLVTNRGMSEAFVGVVLSIFAVAGLIAAAVAGRLARFAPPSFWLAFGSLGFGVSLTLLAPDWGPVGAVVVASLFGLADGIYGVYLNGVTASLTLAELRASFVSVSGTVRNGAKFLAPSALALLVLQMPLNVAMLTLGVASAAVTPLVGPLRHSPAPTPEAV